MTLKLLTLKIIMKFISIEIASFINKNKKLILKIKMNTNVD